MDDSAAPADGSNERPQGSPGAPALSRVQDPTLPTMVSALVVVAAIAVGTLIAPDPWKFVTVGLGVAGVACWVVYRAGERRRQRDLREIAELIERATPTGASAGAVTDTERPLTRVLTQLARLQEQGGPADRADTQDPSLRLLLDAISVPVLAVDADGTIARVNQRTISVFGRGRATVTGSRLEDVFPGEDALTLHDQAASGTAAHGRIRVVLDSNARFFDVVATPTARGPDARWGVTLTLTDVTELATAVQLKSDFAANASHELRTPIAIMRGAVDTLATTDTRDPSDGPMVAKMVAIIASNVSRLEDLVADLLALSRLESSDRQDKPAPYAASELGPRLEEMLASARAERGVTLRFDLHTDLDRMVIDGQLLELILRNLVENAVKFSSPGAEVVITGRAGDVAPALDGSTPPAAEAESRLTGARFRVVDSGEGIPLKDQARIFERFYQVDQSRDGSATQRGTGLGLAIVKHALRRLGGSIRVESVWQEGTTMSFEIPNCVQIEGRPAEDPPRP